MKKSVINKPYAHYVSAICLFLIRKEGSKTLVLLQKRQNTGFADGYWEAGAAGHVDDGENMTQAVIHEAKEEISVNIKESNLEFINLVCKACETKNPRIGERTTAFYMGNFICRKWTGNISIGEPNKIAELKWFDIKHLPAKMIADRKLAIQNWIKGKFYTNHLWK